MRLLFFCLPLTFSYALAANPLQRISGYSIAPGKISVLSAESCDGLVNTFGNCFGNNPAAPYLVGLVPQLPEEYRDQFYATSKVLPGVSTDLSLTYRLREDEAIVVSGKTPPRAAYFGIQSYLFTRFGKTEAPKVVPPEMGNILFTQSPNEERFIQFASLGTAINHVVIAQQQQQASGFQKEFHFISTASPSTAAAIQTALIKEGVSEKAIFVEPLPKLLQLGLDAKADDLSLLLRYALPENEEMAKSWRETPSLTLFRVTPLKSGSSARFENPNLFSRPGKSERAFFASLNELSELLQSQVGAKPSFLFSAYTFGLTGMNCILRKFNCLGDTRDTDSYRIGNLGTLGPKDFAMVIGVNHTLTGNATYQSLAISESEILKGVTSTSQTSPTAGFSHGTFHDSVSEYLKVFPAKISPRLERQKKFLYIQLFARDCSGLPVCNEIPAELDLQAKASVVQRAYLLQGGTEGADPEKMLRPRVFIKRESVERR